MTEPYYVFGATEVDVETRRLDLLEAIYDPFTRELLERIGVPRGSRCLELGAGGGSVALLLLSMCGKFGEVVAADIDLRWMDQISHPSLRNVRHDIVTDDPQQLGSFDFIHARLVLTHLGTENGSEAVARLASMLRPGGRILIEDFCLFQAADPTHPDGPRLVSNMSAWYDYYSTFADPNMGLYMPRLLSNAGLVDVRNELRSNVTDAQGAYRVWLGPTLESIRDVLESNDVFPDGLDAVIRMTEDTEVWYAPILTSATWATRSS